MTAVLPHYTRGPYNKQVATLIFGGQFVCPNTLTAGTTDLTVALCTAAHTPNCLGVAGADANVLATQTGAANTYGQPLIDISVLGDYVAVYPGGWDIPVWYGPSVNVVEGGLLTIAGNFGTVGPYTVQGGAFAAGAGAPELIVGRCTVPGGVSAAMCTQQIGGGQGAGGASTFFLGRAHILT